MMVWRERDGAREMKSKENLSKAVLGDDTEL